jgi:hypothetical protein
MYFHISLSPHIITRSVNKYEKPQESTEFRLGVGRNKDPFAKEEIGYRIRATLGRMMMMKKTVRKKRALSLLIEIDSLFCLARRRKEGGWWWW